MEEFSFESIIEDEAKAEEEFKNRLLVSYDGPVVKLRLHAKPFFKMLGLDVDKYEFEAIHIERDRDYGDIINLKVEMFGENIKPIV